MPLRCIIQQAEDTKTALFNISPETILPGQYDSRTGLPMTQSKTGLVPETLRPLLQKRIALKEQLPGMSKHDIRCMQYKSLAPAHKWLLVAANGNRRISHNRTRQASHYCRDVRDSFPIAKHFVKHCAAPALSMHNELASELDQKGSSSCAAQLVKNRGIERGIMALFTDSGGSKNNGNDNKEPWPVAPTGQMYASQEY